MYFLEIGGSNMPMVEVSNGEFGDDFVELARSVYKLNDERASIKRTINELTKSNIVEEKLYAKYD